MPPSLDTVGGGHRPRTQRNVQSHYRPDRISAAFSGLGLQAPFTSSSQRIVSHPHSPCQFSPSLPPRGLDRSSLGSSVHGILRQGHWRGLPWPSPGALPDPGIEPASPAWRVCRLRNPWEVLGGHHPLAESGAGTGRCGGLGLALVPTKPRFSHQVRSLAFQCDSGDPQEISGMPQKPPREFGAGRVKPASPLPPTELHLHLLFTLRLNTRFHFQNEASCQERKKEQRERGGEKEAWLASRSPTRARERNLLEKRERTRGPLPPLRGKAWLSAHPNHQRFLKGPYKSGRQGGRHKETGEKATPSAELSVYGLSDAPPAVGIRPRETQEPSGKVQGEGDDNRKGGDLHSGLGRRIWARRPRWERTVVGGSGPPVASSSPCGKSSLLGRLLFTDPDLHPLNLVQRDKDV